VWDDLVLDVSVDADGAYRLLDEDEWADTLERVAIAPEVVRHARRAVDEVIALIARRAAPFDTLAAVGCSRFAVKRFREWAMTIDLQTVIIVGLVGYILGLLTALKSTAKADR